MAPPGDKLSRGEKKTQTRDRLLHAAAAAFAERGFAATSIDEVAGRAGLTKGAVYAHFTDKDDLFLGLLEWMVGRRLAALQSALTSDGPVPRQAHEAARWLADFLDQDREWSLLFFEFWLHAARNPGLRERYAGYRRGAQAAVAQLLSERARAAGIVLPASTPALATAVLALASGVALERLVDPEAVPEDLLAAVFATLLTPPPAATDPRQGEPPEGEPS